MLHMVLSVQRSVEGILDIGSACAERMYNDKGLLCQAIALLRKRGDKIPRVPLERLVCQR